MAKNQIRAVLREHDLAAAAPRWLWSAKALAWLGTLDLHASAMLRLELTVQELMSLKVKIDRVEKELACYADRHPRSRS